MGPQLPSGSGSQAAVCEVTPLAGSGVAVAFEMVVG